MIHYERFWLDNGLEVLVHEDPTTTVAVLNLLYKVGSRNEDPEHTGFAHLFEHLMFGGSKNIPQFDAPLQQVGGENNAFTSPDITNYYITVPAANIETAFWLESDRMLSLSFDPKVLEVQRKVVIEEFKQRYLNQPYGDIWHKLRALAYKVHPYRWPTIGLELSHIENVTMEQVKDFFFSHYLPNNAVLVVSGGVKLDQVKALAEKYFGPIPSRERKIIAPPREPLQTEARQLEVEADVPLNAWYRVYHMPERTHPDYYCSDLLSDVIGRGESSYLYQSLVKDKEWLNSFNAYVTASLDPGLLVISGRLNDGISYAQIEDEVDAYLETIQKDIPDRLLEKVKNQAEVTIASGEVDLLNRSMGLAYAAMLGNPELVNMEKEMYRQVTEEEVIRTAKTILQPENSSSLYYKSNQS
jgi:predicted Zn-dependent peptidase